MKFPINSLAWLIYKSEGFRTPEIALQWRFSIERERESRITREDPQKKLAKQSLVEIPDYKRDQTLWITEHFQWKKIHKSAKWVHCRQFSLSSQRSTRTCRFRKRSKRNDSINWIIVLHNRVVSAIQKWILPHIVCLKLVSKYLHTIAFDKADCAADEF